MGLGGDERLARILERGDRGDFEIRMLGEQPQQLAPGVSARAGNGDGQRHGSTLEFDGTWSRRRRHAKKAERVSGAASPRVGAHDGLDGALRSGVRSSCSARNRPYCPDGREH